MLSVIVLLAAAVGVAAAVLIVPRLHHGAVGPGTGKTARPTGSRPVTGSPPPQTPRERAAAGLSGLLVQSVADRSSIVNAVSDVGQCGPSLNTDPQTLEAAATSRQNLLARLASLPGRSALPATMLSALTGAWRNSVRADRDFAQWARDELSRGCTRSDQSDPSYQAASGPDRQATADKQSFVALWNPIATQYGLPTYQWDQL